MDIASRGKLRRTNLLAWKAIGKHRVETVRTEGQAEASARPFQESPRVPSPRFPPKTSGQAAMNRPAAALARACVHVKGLPPPTATAGLVVALFVPLLVLLKRRLPSDGGIPRSSWATICAFADDQMGEAKAGRGPARTVAVETRYRRYSEWCASRGHTGEELVLATALWKEVGQEAGAAGVRVALEPNIVPYHAEAGVAFAC